MGLYRRLLVFLRPHWARLAGNIVSNVVGAALDGVAFTLLIPFLNLLFLGQDAITGGGWLKDLLRSIVGGLLVTGDKMASLRNISVLIVVMVVVKNLFLWLGGQLGASLQERITRDLRDTVFRHMQRLPLGWFSRTKAGQIMARILTDTEQAKAILAEVATRTIQNVAQVLVTIVILVTMSPRLALISLVIVPLISVLLQPLLRRLRQGHRRLRNEYGEITSVLQEVISGIRLVKSFRGERYEDERFTSASGRYTRGMVRITRISLLSGPITEVLGTIVAVVVLGIGAGQVFAGALDPGTLMTFMILVMRLLPPLKQISQAPTTAQQSLAAAERLFQILDEPTEAQRDHGTRAAPALAEAIVFDHVSFAYDGTPVLHDVNFRARRGDVVALVGASGAGKSTLVDLIPRFIEPVAGRITLDGVDTRELTLASLRALTGIVSQDTVLFNDTVRANIAYGSRRPVHERAGRGGRACRERARVHRGARAGIRHDPRRARHAALRRPAPAHRDRPRAADRPAVLILDEATSALDTESERLVQEAIDRLLAGRTVFVIAHRLSTITHATQILVLDRGRDHRARDARGAPRGGRRVRAAARAAGARLLGFVARHARLLLPRRGGVVGARARVRRRGRRTSRARLRGHVRVPPAQRGRTAARRRRTRPDRPPHGRQLARRGLEARPRAAAAIRRGRVRPLRTRATPRRRGGAAGRPGRRRPPDAAVRQPHARTRRTVRLANRRHGIPLRVRRRPPRRAPARQSARAVRGAAGHRAAAARSRGARRRRAADRLLLQ